MMYVKYIYNINDVCDIHINDVCDCVRQLSLNISHTSFVSYIYHIPHLYIDIYMI